MEPQSSGARLRPLAVEAASAGSSPAAAGASSPRALALRDALRDGLRQKLLGDAQRSLRATLRAELRKPTRVRFKDAVFFTGGVLNLVVTEAVLLLAPHRFPWWFVAWSAPLLVWRYVSYTRQRYQWFLLDYCYAANFVCLLHLAWPASPTLFELAFASANGPLAWAILAWRNSLVFHDVDKMTSLFIHAMPPVLMYARRWAFTPGPLGTPTGPLPAYLRCGPDGAGGSCSGSFWEALVLPVAFYVAWQALYFLRTEVLGAAELARDPTMQTSLRWLARSQRGLIHDLAKGSLVALGLMRRDERFDSETVRVD